MDQRVPATTEARHPASAGLHRISPDVALGRMLDGQRGALDRVADALPALERAAEAAAAALSAGHRLIYAGAGSAGLMALADRQELAGTFGIPTDRTPMLLAGGTAALIHMEGAAEDDPSLARADLGRAAPGAGDVLIAVSASGGTPYTVAVAEGARGAGALVIGMANVAGSPLLRGADIPVLLDTGPEVVAGSTRMGAGTAQKAALNLFSTLLGIRLGHVHDGLMVNLVADNAKLLDRAARIVAAVAGCGDDDARRALARAGGAVKPAILIAKGATPTVAPELLARSGGHIGAALAALGTADLR